jgi:hypothetical protein
VHGSSRGGGTRRNRPTTPIFSISQGQVSLPQSARRPVPPHRLVATLPQPSCIYFISIVCDRPNAASGLRRVQALGELARAWFVHILRASSIARFRATEPARSSKSKSPESNNSREGSRRRWASGLRLTCSSSLRSREWMQGRPQQGCTRARGRLGTEAPPLSVRTRPLPRAKHCVLQLQ